MADSNVGRFDPSVVGVSGYERAARDHYPTPRSAYDGLIEAFGDDIGSMVVWEPCCGNGALSTPLATDARAVISTDIFAYPGFEADGIVDFFDVLPPNAFSARLADYTKAQIDGLDPGSTPFSLWDIGALRVPAHPIEEVLKEQILVPDCIITNPPYGKDAERVARHALALMEEVRGDVFLLCRHEWDCAKSRADLFDHPAFASKITLRHRPRWIEGTTTSPRFAYAWFHFSWSKPPGAKPELFYVK